LSQLAAEMDGAATGLRGADIAYVCRAAMFCVKEAARSSNELSDIAIARHHFDAAVPRWKDKPQLGPKLADNLPT
jgi:hypothetical protein